MRSTNESTAFELGNDPTALSLTWGDRTTTTTFVSEGGRLCFGIELRTASVYRSFTMRVTLRNPVPVSSQKYIPGLTRRLS